MRIIPFNKKYRDDLIFMVLEAKNNLGRIPTLNEDLLDIYTYYFKNKDMFWIGIDENNRVIGCLGTKIINKNEMWLKRLYVKTTLKRRGIGSQLLMTAETYAKNKGISKIYTHFAVDYIEAQNFYPKHSFVELEPYKMVKHI